LFEWRQRLLTALAFLDLEEKLRGNFLYCDVKSEHFGLLNNNNNNNSISNSDSYVIIVDADHLYPKDFVGKKK